MRQRPVRALVFLLVLALLILPACAAQNETPAPAAPTDPAAGVLRMVTTATVTTWDPSAAFSTEVSYLSNVYEPLLWANPAGSAEPFAPALAESYTVSPDGLTWTFQLRKGVKFHDGADFDASAVKYSVERTMTLNKGAAYIWSAVQSVEAVDPHTVRFTLSSPVPLDRVVSSGNGAWIISPATAGQDADWWEQGNEAGTGPWKLASYKPGEELVFERFADWWGGWTPAHYEKVVVKIVAEAVTQRQMIEGGDADIAGVVPVESLSALERNPDLAVYKFESFTNYVGFFNTRRPPLDNKLVRQALSYAVPYEDIVTVATEGLGRPARGPVPQSLWPNHPAVGQYKYDPEKAKELLKQAGYPNGGFDLVLTHAAENPAEERFAPLIKEAFAKVGVNVTVQPMLWNQQWTMAKADPAKAQDIFLLMWWPTYTDGYDNLGSMFTTEKKPAWNLAYWYSSTYDDLLARAYPLTGVDPKQSQDLYILAQQLLYEEAPAMYFYDAMDYVVMRKAVRGFSPNPSYPKVIFWAQLSH